MLSPMVTKILTDYIVDKESPPILKHLMLSRFKDKKIKREVSIVG